jgi:Skp family chaperone for outer membrane proteins
MKVLRTTVLMVGISVFAICVPVMVSAQKATLGPKEKTGQVMRIAVIDIQAIQRNAKAIKNIQRQIANYRNVYSADTQKEDEELRTANEKLTRQRAILAPDVFSSKRRKFEERVAEFQRKVQSSNKALDFVFKEAMKVVQQERNALILEISKEFGLSLVLPKDVTILVASPLDATGEVLKRLDTRLAAVKVTDPRLLPVSATE